jgi:multiple sugar transport system substrate-binding protein
MYPEQREVLDEIIVKIRAGRIKRRTFLERAMVVGLSSSAAISLLEACGGSSNSQGGNGSKGTPVSLVWQSENDSSPAYKTITDNFNNTIGKQKGIHVTWNNGPSDSATMLTKYTTMFRARSGSTDITSIDIIYPAQFGASGWLNEITDSQWSASERDKYLQGPIKGCTYQGKLWAAPYRTDLGILYYRKDLLSSPPATYDDLVSQAKGASPSKIKYGYVWQGSQYEGLVCDFVEVVHGYNGEIIDANNKVVVNSPEVVQALTQMVSWVGTISPSAVTTYTEDPSRLTWQNGDSAFMRNWPYAYSLGNDPKQSKIAGKFDIASLPHGGSGTAGHSAIGGWNLGINAFSKNPDAAWEFIKYTLQPEAQKEGAIGASFTVTLQSIYDDSDVQSKEPLFTKLKPILQNALPRPVSARYSDVTNVIQRHVYQALKKQVSPAQAISAMESELKPLVASS